MARFGMEGKEVLKKRPPNGKKKSGEGQPLPVK